MKEKEKSDEVRKTVMAAQEPRAEPLHTTQLCSEPKVSVEPDPQAITASRHLHSSPGALDPSDSSGEGFTVKQLSQMTHFTELTACVQLYRRTEGWNFPVYTGMCNT